MINKFGLFITHRSSAKGRFARVSAQRCHQSGFTLVESIVAIVVMAVAMVVLLTIFFPRIANAPESQYQTRAAALGQSMMSTILSRDFDEKSSDGGNYFRCDDENNSATKCLTTLGTDGESDVSYYNDVDDYKGCWYTNTWSLSLCTTTPKRPLTTILGQGIADEYANFVVNIKVTEALVSNAHGYTMHQMRKIEMDVAASKFEAFELTAFKGNY